MANAFAAIGLIDATNNPVNPPFIPTSSHTGASLRHALQRAQTTLNIWRLKICLRIAMELSIWKGKALVGVNSSSSQHLLSLRSVWCDYCEMLPGSSSKISSSSSVGIIIKICPKFYRSSTCTRAVLKHQKTNNNMTLNNKTNVCANTQTPNPTLQPFTSPLAPHTPQHHNHHAIVSTSPTLYKRKCVADSTATVATTSARMIFTSFILNSAVGNGANSINELRAGAISNRAARVITKDATTATSSGL